MYSLCGGEDVADARKGPGGAARALARKLQTIQRSGVTHIPKSKRVRTGHSGVASQPGAQGTSDAPEAAQSDRRVAALAAVARRVAACTRCAELAATRTQTVFGSGNPHARLVFMGEAPGYEEDQQGLPFVGRAGQMLSDIIAKGMGLRREDVYILNTIKCRPPENRTPLPVEIAHCREYLDEQLAILQPEFICCLGAVAAGALLGVSGSLGRLRGRFHDLRGIKVICTYHPAYLLRSPAAKQETWDDIQLLMREMGLPVPGGK